MLRFLLVHNSKFAVLALKLRCHEHHFNGACSFLPDFSKESGLACVRIFELLRGSFQNSRNLNCRMRSEEHTSELQSQSNLVCRLLLEKKKKIYKMYIICK